MTVTVGQTRSPEAEKADRLSKQLLELEVRFTYHPPREDQVPRYNRLRSIALAFARDLVELTPESREQSLALTHLDQVVMFANAAIARRE